MILPVRIIVAVAFAAIIQVDSAKAGIVINDPVQGPVVGGTVAKKENWPWVVALLVNGSPVCNATLIAPDAVLTAELCVDRLELGELRVYRDLPGGPDAVGVSEIIVRPQPAGRSRVNVAVLKLSSKLAGPFAILSTGATDPADGILALATVYDLRDRLPATLLQVAVPVGNQARCAQQYQEIGKENICAGFIEGGADACQGSSGGPLSVHNAKGSKYQIGIVAYGRGCAKPDSFGVYARVSFFADWIKSIVPSVKFEDGTAEPTPVGR